MKRCVVILLLFMLAMVPVAASETEENRPVYNPDTEEVGGTIYGTLSGKSLEEQEKPEKPVDPSNPEKPVDPINPEKPNKNPEDSSSGSTSTGSNTGDQATLFLWIILFVGAYCILRKYFHDEISSEE